MQKLIVFNCTLIFLAGSMLPACASEDTSAPGLALRGLSLVESVNPVEIDSAGSDSPEQKLARPVKAVEPETPMQTIDSESTKVVEPETPMQTIDSQPTKTTQPEEPATEPQQEKTAEPETQDIQPEALTQPAEPTEKKDVGTQAAHFVSHLPQRLALFSANVVVAAPATFVRRSVQYTSSNTKELIGDHKNPILFVPATTLSMYYAMMSGLCEGTVLGVTNSWKHSADGKISKASLGLVGH